MKKGRRNHSAEFKDRVALEAIKGIKSMRGVASESAVRILTRSVRWKKQVLEKLRGIFGEKRGREAEIKARLYQHIRQLRLS